MMFYTHGSLEVSLALTNNFIGFLKVENEIASTNSN